MTDINRVMLIGRLTRDAELRYTNNSGNAVCKFSIAVNNRKKQGDQWVDEAHFFDIVLWGKSGEAISQYLTKGKQVAIEGELRQNRWEQDGQQRSKVEINANQVQLLGGGAGGQGGQGERGFQGAPQQSPKYEDRNQGRQEPPQARNVPPPDDFNDDIPF